ncbi:OmpH family outer membrane protein [Acetobacteraceae bacterium KSS8]|uniref:OmpH family outer membrane protein n=1 Tax=Endosaccharibacter trunci TaxID=2812733 RepID=A0ABT1W3D5_9PROT|nr:OmpH family outer membrane protein [Acetobacteraceae bacterium KSS8]
MSRSTRVALVAGLLLAQGPIASLTVAHAQQGGYFMPKSAQPAAEPAHRRAPESHAQRSAAPAPVPAQIVPDSPAPDDGGAGPQAQPVLPLPPVPNQAELPKGAAPPAPVIGVISVPEVMHESQAGQQVESVLGARRDKLSQDAQKEQAAWRDTEKQIQEQVKGGLSQAQAQAKVRALQLRAQNAQKEFRDRNRIIQEAAQVAIGQIERELVQVIKQVAASRGMNLVLHREQVALNFPDFDITAQVISQLNATLPSVFIPADGVDPEVLAKSGTYPTTANPGPAPNTVPVAAPVPPQAAPEKK